MTYYFDEFKVIELANTLHAGQYRKHKIDKNKLPYIFHAFDVSRKLWSWGIGDKGILAAAMLHDTIEDIRDKEAQAEARDKILLATEKQVLIWVEELTHFNNGISKEDYIKSFSTKSIEALVIKIADRLCNVQDFNRTDSNYAEKYYHKADILFRNFRKRKEEVIARFSKNIYDDIEYDIDDADRWEVIYTDDNIPY